MSTRGYGGGGKGGGARTPVEEKDNLRSVQYAEVLDLISEGEIQGLVNGLKSVYLDKVPIQNNDGSFNFEGVQFNFTPGTQGQAALPGFPGVQAEVAVAVLVDAGVPVVRTITNPAADTVRVTIGVPQLTTQNLTNGDTTGADFEFAIDIQSDGGGYVERYRSVVAGKTTSRYQRAVRLSLDGPAPWDVRVRRVSPAAPGSHVQNAFYWDSYTEIQSVRLRYPNSSLGGLRVSAQSFSRVPTRGYDVLGIRCKVPTNFDAYTGTYTGAWDGTFKLSWTDSPAWVLYDLATNPRYGLGEYVTPDMVDKWGLYEIGKYCHEMVSNGRGGMEPRFTFNGVLRDREDAKRVLQNIAAVFRGMVVYAGSMLRFVQDAPADPVMLFTPANVVGQFSYAGTSVKTKHSVALVYWNDPDSFFERVPEVVTDPEMVAKIGIETLELGPIGVTSRSQAARVGRWALYSEQAEVETVTFSTGLEGGGIGVGQVFKIHDPSEAGERLGGRVKAGTTSLVTLDRQVELQLGESYTLIVMRPSASSETGYVTEERAVTSGAGVVAALAVAPNFTVAPEAHDIWILASSAVAPTTWRCLDVSEQGKQWKIVAVQHDPDKFARIEQGIVLEPRPISRLTSRALAPTNLQMDEVLYVDRSTYKSRLNVAWSPPTAPGGGNQRYRTTWRFESGVIQTLPDTTDQTVEISGLEPGTVEVWVRGINAIGKESLPLYGSFEVLGKFAPPSDMTGLVLSVATKGVEAVWDEPPDVDWQASELSTSPLFLPAAQLTLKRSTTHLVGWLPAGVNTFYGRHWDEERPSAVGQSASITILAPAAPTLLRAEAQDNVLLLRWSDCATSQPIRRFVYRLGDGTSTWSTATDFGGAGGDQRSDILTFNTAGLKRVFIAGEDMAGNIGAATFVDITAVLPNNFTLTDQLASTFAGTRTHAQLPGDGTLLMLVDGQSWADHFTTNGWSTIGAQVAAGKPLYFEPGTTTASYAESYDLGRVVPSATIAFVAQYAWLAGAGTLVPTISYKEHVGDPWTDVVGSWATVATAFRYVRIVLNAAAAGADDLLQVTALAGSISVRELQESVPFTSLAADAAGTVYVTTKGFFDLTGAHFTPAVPGVAFISAVCDDSVLPPVVRVKCWDNTLTRINAAGSLLITGA